VSQAVVACADKVVALATQHSLGVSAFVQFASLDHVDSLAVAGAPSQATLQPFLERGITTIVGGTS
jgi:DeoR/GlpR family transcriptional regulator of sugar metabolism